MSDRIGAALHSVECDQLIIEDPLDIFYLTGVTLSLGTLVLERGGGVLYVDGRYLAAAKECSTLPVAPIAQLWDREWGEQIGFDATRTMYSRFTLLASKLDEKRLTPLSAPLAPLRACKDERELTAMRASCALLKKGMQYAKTLLKEGITERALATAFEAYVRQHGASGLSFEPIVAFGENGAYPHHCPRDRPLELDEAVLLDAGVVVDHYCSDMTRVYPFGTPPSEVQHIHAVVKRAQRAAIGLCFPGTPLVEVDRAARSLIEEAGYGEAFCHSLGHGVGLEVHEAPRISSEAEGELKTGMVVTIEPGIYLPGIGGVRHEDMVVITESGPVVL